MQRKLNVLYCGWENVHEFGNVRSGFSFFKGI
jgi:hypothetical protein